MGHWFLVGAQKQAPQPPIGVNPMGPPVLAIYVSLGLVHPGVFLGRKNKRPNPPSE